MVPIRVRGELEVRVNDLPPGALQTIKAALTLPNEDREAAQREHAFGWWDMPESLYLWKVFERRGEKFLSMPRGFARQLGQGLTKLGAEIQWTDERAIVSAAPGYFRPFPLRDYQLDAVKALLKAEQGFYQAPAGSGKTITMLGMIAYCNLRTLVIIDKADIIDQWIERASDPRFLGLTDVGKISQGIWEEKDLTIALRQALWARTAETDALQFWKGWGCVIFDEGHKLGGETLGEISRKVVSRLMLGTSATPSKTETRGKIVNHLVGPIVHITPRQKLRDAGILVTPHVRHLPTEIDLEFWDTHDVTSHQDCKVPKCRKTGQNHSHRNNYSSCLKSLVADEDRNKQIAEQVVSEPNHVHLIPSRQKKHLDLLKKAIEEAGWTAPIYYLRGEENARGESRGIVEQIMNGQSGCVILSTVADEALDIPPIDRVHIVFPMRQAAALIQLIGRGERSCEGKTEFIVHDYVDLLTEVFLNQFWERDRTYRSIDCVIDQTIRKTEQVGS